MLTTVILISGVVLAGTGQGFTPHILTVNTGEVDVRFFVIFVNHLFSIFGHIGFNCKCSDYLWLNQTVCY